MDKYQNLCLQDVLERVAKGETKQVDADFLRLALSNASQKIRGLQEQIVRLRSASPAQGQRVH